MRALITVLVLLPVLAILVYGCDEQPTAPEAQATTPAQQETTPQTDRKPPTLPTPVALSGYIVDVVPVLASCPPGPNCCAGNLCPAGKVMIAGGFETNSPDFVLTRARPSVFEATRQVGWAVCVANTGSERLELGVTVACADGVVEVE